MKILGGVLLSLFITTAHAQPMPCNAPKVMTFIKDLLKSDWQWGNNDDWAPNRVEIDEDTVTTLDTNGLIRMCAASIKGFGPDDTNDTNGGNTNDSVAGGGGTSSTDAEYDHDIYYRLIPSDNGKDFWFDYLDKSDTIRKPQ
jgi:hypothetical protein